MGGEKNIILKNGKLILPDRILNNASLKIANGLIVDYGLELACDAESEVLDVNGQFIAPGFVDMHVHGGGGADFMDGTVEAFLTVVQTHAQYGTTSIVPTTLTSTTDELFALFDIYEQALRKNTEGARMLGLHLEGPYFSPEQCGAQDKTFLKNPDPTEYRKILQSTNRILRWSIAPELSGALEMCEELITRDIVVSIAHSNATYEEAVTAFDKGFSLITHLYSAMSSITRRNAYRYAGVLESAYLIDEMDVEIIADGIHLPKSLLQFVCKFKDRSRIALITDAMRGAGMPEGIYKLGSLEKGQPVLVEDGVAKLMDRTAFAGSVATSNRLVKNMVELGGVDLVEAVKMASLNPARMLGFDHKIGSIEKGKIADIILFDSKYNVSRTMIKGKTVYIK